MRIGSKKNVKKISENRNENPFFDPLPIQILFCFLVFKSKKNFEISENRNDPFFDLLPIQILILSFRIQTSISAMKEKMMARIEGFKKRQKQKKFRNFRESKRSFFRSSSYPNSCPFLSYSNIYDIRNAREEMIARIEGFKKRQK